uniref:hypothetical protein n=1 Tax=Escherichia albertii TaxID=208962 RepID=UPI000744456A|nr:hypothetical protein [Escherichia albertii]
MMDIIFVEPEETDQTVQMRRLLFKCFCCRIYTNNLVTVRDLWCICGERLFSLFSLISQVKHIRKNMFSVGICSSVITGVLLNAYNIHILILLSTWYITASYLDEVHHLIPAVEVPVCQEQGEYIQSYSGLV